MSDISDEEKEKKRIEHNQKRRRRRLEKHTGLDWIDPEHDYSYVRGERALWRAVIVQMLEDAAFQSDKPEDKYNREVARNWLTIGSEDFYMVCDFAGFDVNYIRKNVKKALLNNCKWRRESTPRVLKKKKLKAKRKRRARAKATTSSCVLTFYDFQKKTA